MDDDGIVVLVLILVVRGRHIAELAHEKVACVAVGRILLGVRDDLAELRADLPVDACRQVVEEATSLATPSPTFVPVILVACRNRTVVQSLERGTPATPLRW